MLKIAFFTALFATIAGRVAALNIVMGSAVVPASQFLTVPDQTMTANCQSSCSPATQAITTCTDSNDACLCNNATVTAITACEQCYFNDLIKRNVAMSDPTKNPSPALAAYSAACLSSLNQTIPATEIAIALPANWDGPFGLGLGMPATIFTVIVTTFLGGGLIYTLCSM